MVSELVTTKTSPDYDSLRSRYFNSRVPPARPLEIHSPTTTSEVVEAVQSARDRGLKVGVRSGGHSFTCLSLVDEGLLIDTRNLNKDFTYDTVSKEISFSPGCTVQELASNLGPLGRFFPFGHAKSVGAGGFYLAGGQGCFLRGWGYTCDDWVTQIEVVMPSGEVVIANNKENTEIFWAAPGSGLGFFGVLTRIWGRTVPARKIYDITLVFDATDIFKPLLKWFFETSDKVPKYGSDLMFVSFYADKDGPPEIGDVSQAKRVMVAINQTIWADSKDEAVVLASPWKAVPQEFEKVLVANMPLAERSWVETWDVQDQFQPSGAGTRYKVDSILTDPTKSWDEVIEKITPAVYDLPTRRSTGNICHLGDYYPDEADHALSLPQKCSVTTITTYNDADNDSMVDSWTTKAYAEAEQVAVGQYVADYDRSQRQTKIMSDTAMKKWLAIRAKWDPKEMFIGYRGFGDDQN